jgi:hypothetical protein
VTGYNVVYRSINWLAGLNLNIPANMRECYKFSEFWTTLYIGYWN